MRPPDSDLGEAAAQGRSVQELHEDRMDLPALLARARSIVGAKLMLLPASLGLTVLVWVGVPDRGTQAFP